VRRALPSRWAGSAALAALGELAAVVAAGAGVLALDVAFVPAVDGGVDDRVLSADLASFHCGDGVVDDHLEQRVVVR
jgi:hypothetical protein